MEKRYLGDAVYVDHDGFYFVLTAEDGTMATNTIYLEPQVFSALLDYVKDLKALHQAALGTNQESEEEEVEAEEEVEE